MKRIVYMLPFLLLLLVTCGKHTPAPLKEYKTEHVIIVVIDGPRYSETWGDSTHANIPHRWSLLEQGVFAEKFYNNGTTFTNPGHTAVSTGNYDPVANDGSELPHNPTIFQTWRKTTQEPSTKACLIASKDKIHFLSNSSAAGYTDMWRPYSDCGVNGNGTGGHRSDAVTQQHLLSALKKYQPHLVIVNFKDPDTYAHAGNYAGYINGIQQTDAYIAELWNYLQSDPYYRDKTTLIVTNDHGRHTTNFVSHGDGCDGCRHIELFALSPDFKQNAVVHTPYQQIDIHATVAELLHVQKAPGKGRVMKDLFK
jgi:hypothetical protein